MTCKQLQCMGSATLVHLLFMFRLLQLGLLDYEVVLTLTLKSTLTLLHCILLC